jgi:hypothetical protein
MRSVWPIQILAGTILFTGCDTTVASPPVRHDVQFRTDTNATAYFGVFRTWGDSVWLLMFAATLQGMDEPPLRSATLMQSERVLRFTWQRTFHPDVAVRVTESAAFPPIDHTPQAAGSTARIGSSNASTLAATVAWKRGLLTAAPHPQSGTPAWRCLTPVARCHETRANSTEFVHGCAACFRQSPCRPAAIRAHHLAGHAPPNAQMTPD